MMNAQVVWNVWRRIMREPGLQQAVFDQDTDKHNLAAFGLADDECEAALAYRSEADRARWFVVNYRYRLTNSFLNALETGAPLVLRALLARGFNLPLLGGAFLDKQGWRDYGPYVYTYCKEALQFLAHLDTTAEPEGLRQLIGLEQTVVELLLSLRGTPSAKANDGLLAQTPFARHYACNVRLSTWLRDKKLLGITDLEKETEHYLVYLTDSVSAPKFTLVPQRAAEIYNALVQPCTRAELPAALAACGYEAYSEQDDDYLRVLQKYRAVIDSTRS